MSTDRGAEAATTAVSTLPAKTSEAPEAPRRVAIVGPRGRGEQVAQVLGSLEADIVRLSSPERLPLAGVDGIVVCPSARYTLPQAIRRLRRRAPLAPILTIVTSEATPKVVHAMFECGAAAVVDFAREAFCVAPLLTQLMARAEPPSTRPEIGVRRGVDLRVALQLGAPIRAAPEDGIVELHGEVSSLPDKQEAIAVAARTPGVVAVRADDLVVAAAPRPTERLARDVRTALAETVGIDSSTLVGDVTDDRRVVLAGTVSTTDERNLVRRVVADVPGVRGIDDHTAVSPEQKARDRRVRRRAELVLEALRGPDDRLWVSVFGEVGLVDGHVADPRRRDEVKAELLARSPLQRVLNRIEVRDQR